MLFRPITMFCYPTIFCGTVTQSSILCLTEGCTNNHLGVWGWLINRRCSRMSSSCCGWNPNGNSQTEHESKHVSSYAHLWHWETHCSWYCIYCLAIRNRCHWHLHFPGFVRFHFKLSSLEARCWDNDIHSLTMCWAFCPSALMFFSPLPYRMSCHNSTMHMGGPSL